MTSSLFVPTLKIKQGVTTPPVGIIIAVDGTSYPGFPFPPSYILNNGSGFFSGFSSGLIGGVINCQDGLWDSWAVAYSAPTTPMWPGVQQAREYIVEFLLWYIEAFYSWYGFYPAIVFTGYSQGSMAIDQVWLLDILADDGRLAIYQGLFYRIYQFGHIFRTPGWAKGNALIGLPESIKQGSTETGGIGTTQDIPLNVVAMKARDGNYIYHSCANKGDIYTCNACGTNPWTDCAPEGIVGHDFMKVIMQATLADIMGLAGVLLHPLDGILELIHTMVFFAAGPNAPHYQYYPHMVGCINDCYQLGLDLQKPENRITELPVAA